MSDEGQMKLRLPADLLASVKAAAAGNARTMNAEIVARLTLTFEPERNTEVRSRAAYDNVMAGVKPMTDAERIKVLAKTVDRLEVDLVELRDAFVEMKLKVGLE